MGIWAASFGDDEVCEVHGSQDFSLSVNDGASGSVSLMCDWSIRHEVMADILPKNVYGSPVVRSYWPYGDYINQPYATRIGCKPFETAFTGEGQAINYRTALLTVQYERRPDSEPDDLVSETIESTAEFITLDHKRFTWKDADGPALDEKEAPGRLVRGLILSRTYYKIQAPLPGGLLTLPGHVNQTAYTSTMLGLTFAAETLLFSPNSMDRTITTDGDSGFNVNLQFMYKPETWNKFWRQDEQEYQRIWDTENEEEYENYPTGDFAAFLS